MASRARANAVLLQAFSLPIPVTGITSIIVQHRLASQASKVASQRRWRRTHFGREYFRGQSSPSACEDWRQDHPGYWNKQNLTRNGLKLLIHNELTSVEIL